MFLFAGILNFISSYLIASVVQNFIAIYIVFFAFVVLNMEILSLFNGIYDYNLAVFSVVNLIFSILFFKYKKVQLLKVDISFKRILNALWLDKSLIILFFAFLILITVCGILAYIMPPLEPDAQAYHFYRAFQFSNNHNLLHFDVNDIRAIIMPINSEIVYAWIFTLKHKFYNFALLSYFSYFAVIMGIWQILGYLKFSVRKKMFAIFVFSSLASTVVETCCLQTDIVVGALTVSSLVLFLKKKNYLSSLSFAIALGVKSTAFIVLVPYLFIIFLLNKKDFKRYILYLVFNFIIFSSYNYILNFIHYTNPISNNAALMGHGFWGGFKGYIANLIHFSFQFMDFTGFTWGYYLNNKLFALKDNIFQIMNFSSNIGNNIAHKQINITTDEQVVGFGILGFLAVIPAVFKGLFSKKKLLSYLAIAFILNILILARFMAYMEYSIRFVLTFVCFSASLCAILYTKRGLYKFLICFFCIFYMAIIPIYIRRAPFYKIWPYLIENNFNLDKFVNDCYEGKIISVWQMTPIIKNIIKERYSSAKKIAFFKKKASSSLYLKIGLNVDFLTTANFKSYDLSKYDLLIFEGDFQDDDVFKETKIEYIKDGENVKFKNDNSDCFYLGPNNNQIKDGKDALVRWCIGTHQIKQNKNFKLDYHYEFESKDIGFEDIYFYTKLN